MLDYMTGIETSSTLFSQAATLMFVGMLFVFSFLSLMIVVIKLFISPLAKKYPDKILQPTVKKKPRQKDNSAIIAAITVAIKQYRSNR